MPLHQCLGVDGESCSELTNNSRCPEHQREIERRTLRAKRTRRPAPDAQETARRAAAVAAWIAEHGYWCPGWGVAQHQSTDLTADHVIAFGAGGAEDGELTVLCRACNGRKGART